MKVTIQCFNLAPHDLGGSERSARELANGLNVRGHDVRFVVSDGSKPYPPKLDDMPIDIVAGLPIGKSPLWGARRFLSRVLWSLRSEVDPVLFVKSLVYLRRHRPDVILMNNPAGYGSALMAAAQWLGIACIPIFRDYGWFCAFGIMMRGGGKIATGYVAGAVCSRCAAARCCARRPRPSPSASTCSALHAIWQGSTPRILCIIPCLRSSSTARPASGRRTGAFWLSWADSSVQRCG